MTTEQVIRAARGIILSIGLKLDPNFKEKWLNELRSGEYQQIARRLHESGGYCCLGVGCEILDEGEWMHHGDGPHAFKIDDRIHDGLPPAPALADMFGIDQPHQNTVIDMRRTVKALASLNDDGASFETIADVIEQTL